MKNIVSICTFLIASVFFNSCSNNDDAAIEAQGFVITLESECENENSRITYCVSEEEFNATFDDVAIDEPCIFVIITDINGNKQSGILRSGTTRSCSTL